MPENLSLKGKRHVIKSIIARVASKFSVSVAEVDDQDAWQLATLGICIVSNDGRHNNEVLCKIVDFITGARLEAEVLDYEIELISVM